MEQIQKRKLRVEVLLVLVVIAGLMWSSKFDISKDDAGFKVSTVEAPVVASDKPVIIAGPDPDAFSQFELPSSKTIRKEVTCADAYYTLAMFPVGSDYRTSPRSAVYNTATSCMKGVSVDATLSLSSIQASAGMYYLIVADQGAFGSWYNPR